MAEAPRVAVDIAPVHSIVSAVMGDIASPDLILPPGASPHGYSLRPSEARALSSADLIVWMGPALTPWLEGPVESLAGDSDLLTLLAHPQTMLLDVREGATFGAHDHGDHGHDAEDHDAHDDHAEHDEDHADHAAHDDDHAEHAHEEHAHEEHDHDHAEHAEAEAGHDDHAHEENVHEEHEHDHEEHAEGAEGHEDHAEHAHNGSDPHAWLDPRNASIWAGLIADTLSDLDPDNAAVYTENARRFQADLATLEAEIAATLAPVQGVPFVVFHDAYHYFEHRFETEAAGAVSANDAASPSPARVAELRAEIEELGAVCALTEPQFNPGILNALGAVRLSEVDPIGVDLPVGSTLYPAVLRNMAQGLVACVE
ncbi:zinc ABC transporter substrate-binding protein [Tateyamaria sp. SN3-11]|uniref:zinc ABC transporter substrate-binding protein n=1 Tax=Tateyamaria sp. SN3-11 TaxID=3092147 RepID=UPI0039EAA6FC